MEEGGHCLVSSPPLGYNAGQEYRNEQAVSFKRDRDGPERGNENRNGRKFFENK